MSDDPKPLKKVIDDEKIAIAARREKLGLPQLNNDLTGIALSGGGIRSATVCIGVLSFFNECGLLEKADYLSSVSGGGYAASYVHATLKENDSEPKPFDSLFDPEHIKKLKKKGNYLGSDFFGCCRIAGAFIFSFFMNLVWILATFVAVSTLLGLVLKGITSQIDTYYGEVLLSAAIIVLIIHFLFHGLRGLVWRSSVLYKIEGIIFAFAAPYAFYHLFMVYAGNDGIFTKIFMGCPYTAPAADLINKYIFGEKYFIGFAASVILLYIVGFFANPNLLTFHRFYRDRLAQAYLFLSKGIDKKFKLYTLNPGAAEDSESDSEPAGWGRAPYPLINTCLNLLGRNKKDRKKGHFLSTAIKMCINLYCRNEKEKNNIDFAGTATNEHFLLSPLYCGSALTDYVPSSSIGYRSMTLATAMAVSGAAVNPSMGHKTNRFLAFLMTLLNMRLGYWSANPACRPLHRLPWWPAYHLAELFSKSNINRPRVLLSDGGHIENLGIFELLRRRCRLIIAVDSGADPGYTFSDLQSLVIQARNILDLKIEFIIKPEDNIRPTPSFAFSKEHFAVARISALTVPGGHDSYSGILIYIKSSLKAPMEAKKKNIDGRRSYDYKTWHTAFPHESTVDQFFDEDQWEAYYTLGRHMAEETLKKALGIRVKDEINSEECRKIGLDDWVAAFEKMASSPQQQTGHSS